MHKTLISYMEEIGWFNTEGMVYIVWLHGATDGWPQAIFLSKDVAEHFVNNCPMNPEGYTIEEINFNDLICECVGVGEF